MHLARRVFFLLTCFQVYVSASAGVMVLSPLFMGHVSVGSGAGLLIMLWAGLFFSAALVNGMTAWRMRSDYTRWLWAASLLNLIIIPVGTGVGLFGLALLTQAKFRRPEPRSMDDIVAVTNDSVSPKTKLIAVLLPLLIAALLTFVGFRWANQATLPDEPVWVWLAWGQLAFFLSSLMHELGHLACGWISDFRLMTFHVGAFHWERRGNRWRFRFVARRLLNAGGHCGMLPASLRQVGSRAVFYAAGGPLGSLVAGITGAIAYFSCGGTPLEPAWPFFQTLMIIGGSMALANLIPLPTGAAILDGARMRQFAKVGLRDQLLVRSLESMARQTDLRPRSWDTETVERAAQYGNSPKERVLFPVLAATMYEDRQQPAKAKVWMDLALKLGERAGSSPEVERAAASLAIFAATEKGDAKEARQWLGRTSRQPGARSRSAEWALAEAAVLVAEGHRARAMESWKRARDLAAKMPAAGLHDWERARIEGLGERWFGGQSGPAANAKRAA